MDLVLNQPASRPVRQQLLKAVMKVGALYTHKGVPKPPGVNLIKCPNEDELQRVLLAVYIIDQVCACGGREEPGPPCPCS